MRFYKTALVFMLGFALILCSALADGQVIPLHLPDDFWGEVHDVLPDGALVACGGTGIPAERKPALLEIHLDGTTADITPPSDSFEGAYLDFISLDEDSYILVRDVPNDPEHRYIGRIDSNAITWRSEPVANLFSIDRVKDGFLVNCKPQPVTAEIRKMDFDGNEIWKLRFEERMVIKGILTGDGVHAAYGMVYEDPQPDNRDQRFTSLIFAFDDHGKLLWRHDGDELGYSTPLIDAVWAGDGGVIAISSGRAFKFDAEKELWRREFDRFTNVSALALEDGRCLVFCSGHHEAGMPIRIMDDDGSLLKELYLPEAIWGSADPIRINGDLYLAINSGMQGIMHLVRLELEL